MLGKFARGSGRAPLVVVDRRCRASSCASGSNLENPSTVSNPRCLASPPIAINWNSIFGMVQAYVGQKLVKRDI